ncbi:MAG: hypothetical protein PWQ17_887, partial [Anaerophaga sp.]|nr:hypothetical protein [Anaerophaga sp.]
PEKYIQKIYKNTKEDYGHILKNNVPLQPGEQASHFLH